jgi:hypothetical protein
MNTSETENCSKEDTSITLRCDWEGNYIVIYKGDEFKYDNFLEANKHMMELVRPAQGDPK